MFLKSMQSIPPSSSGISLDVILRSFELRLHFALWLFVILKGIHLVLSPSCCWVASRIWAFSSLESLSRLNSVLVFSKLSSGVPVKCFWIDGDCFIRLWLRFDLLEYLVASRRLRLAAWPATFVRFLLLRHQAEWIIFVFTNQALYFNPSCISCRSGPLSVGQVDGLYHFGITNRIWL